MLYLVDDEILVSFLEECDLVLSGMAASLNGFVEGTETFVFEDYGQQVDRIMGAAYTLSLTKVGDLCKLGKEIGYKASQVSDIHKLLAVHSLLNQLVRVLEAVLKKVAKAEQPDYTEADMLKIKLEKASEDLGDLRVTVKVPDV